MKTRPFVPDPALVAFLGLTPLIGATREFSTSLVVVVLSGFLVMGAALAGRFLPTTLGAGFRSAASTGLVVLLAALATLFVRWWSPLTFAQLGIYLPLTAVSSLIVHELRRERPQDRPSLRESYRFVLRYILTGSVLGLLRDLFGHGSISLPGGDLVGNRIAVFGSAPLPILGEAAGALFLLGLMAFADRAISLSLERRRASR